ncbi:MAG TPA: hypothetical protein DG414_07055 [Gammaproteobacteria bacterium]|nr:tetratricopeptide repeat protein [Arenicellales bacterium]MDP6948680.1 tetratricopeptide repeat protein [Arenicellales bacterium]HCY13580.1 hypothetical protein [Gammaproteobacteria bacterium]
MSAPRLQRRPQRLTCAVLVATGFVLFVTAVQADRSQAQSQLAAGHYPEALAEVNLLLIQHPDDAELAFLRARILAASGQNEAAISTYRTLVQRFPKNPAPYNNLATLLAARGEFTSAAEQLLTGLQIDPVYQVLLNNLLALYAHEAAVAYQRALDPAGTNTATAGPPDLTVLQSLGAK